MKTNAIDTENLVKVGNAVLNAKAVKQLELLQENDNQYIDDRIKQNCRIMQFLAKNIYLFDDNQKNDVMQHMETIACEIDDFEKLKKD